MSHSDCPSPSEQAGNANNGKSAQMYTKEDRYRYEVLVVCSWLAGDCSGTYESLPGEKRALLRDWLKWRVSEGWAPNTLKRMEAYEESVRALAKCALNLEVEV